MKLFLVLASFAAMAALDLPDMIKNKLWRDLVIYSICFAAVLVLGVLIALDVKVPSPIKAIQVFYRDILHLSFPPS